MFLQVVFRSSTIQTQMAGGIGIVKIRVNFHFSRERLHNFLNFRNPFARFLRF